MCCNQTKLDHYPPLEFLVHFPWLGAAYPDLAVVCACGFPRAMEFHLSYSQQVKV